MSYKERFLKDIEEKFKIQIDADIIQAYYWQVLEEKDKEIERLHSIIKEAIEFINNNSYESGDTSSMYLIDTDKLLEILGSDKE